MNVRTWGLLGLALGAALAVGVLAVDPAVIERAVTTIGLDRITPYAQPPLGQTARVVLALALLVFGVALGWGLGRLLGRKPVDEVDEADGLFASPAPVIATPPQIMDIGWRTPATPEPRIDEEAAPTPEPTRLEPATSPQTLVAETAPSPPPPIPRHLGTEPDPHSATQITEPITAEANAPMPDHAPALARLEAMVTDLARHGPPGFDQRLEAIDARLAQMAQQLAELSALARVQQRTPLAVPAPTRAQPPADPAHRRALAQTARELRSRLEDAAFA